ncbi:MAG TPA: HAMP domain-containing sensor histidine kinase, partial [Quisquiliibacterium sp.]|nr:HAMP domain-containing sensor histidine kinase [Quisquiliibacterium sp.]
AGMQRALSGGWFEVVRPLLADYLDRLTAELGTPPDPARAAALAQRLPLSIRIDGPQVQWDSGTARPRGRRDDAGEARGSDGHRGDRFLVRTTADGHRVTYGVAVDAWERRPRAIGWLTLALLLALTTVAYFATRRLIRPIDDIRAGALRFGRGEFSQPIRPRRDDELGELALQVNAMASSLQRMLEARRGLLLAASHELRSPLTRARLNAELVAEGPAREALLRDLAEMRDLIADLLEGERLAAGRDALQREELDPDALVRALVSEQFSDLPMELSLQAGPAPLALDPVRVKLLLRNLLDNARRHAAGAVRPTRVSSALEGEELVITVRDHGPGVPPEALARLAEPFYRPDAARQRVTGGVGLGLYLCRLVAEAHGGSVGFADAGPGLAVTVRLPVRPASA